MKDGVNTVDGIWKPECIGMSSGLGWNFKWTQELFGKLFGWPGHAEKLCFDKCLLFNDKVRSRHPMGICITLVMVLSFGNGGFEFLVEFIQIDNKIFSTGECKIAFWMNGEVQVITHIGKKWRNTSSSTRSIVVGEFHKQKKCIPIVLLVVAEYVQVLL